MIWSDRDYGLTHSGLAVSSDPPGWCSQERGLGALIRRHSSEGRGHAPQKSGQGGTPMIARHVRMQFPPQTLDAIEHSEPDPPWFLSDTPVNIGYALAALLSCATLWWIQGGKMTAGLS